MNLLRDICIFFSCLICIVAIHIKGLDDSILFRLSWPGYSENLLNSPDHEEFEVFTSNNEKFKCMIPRSYGVNESGRQKYVGPNPLALLMPMFKIKTCSLRREMFWTYELCHGMRIRQFHEETEQKSSHLQEYILGVSSLEELKNKVMLLDDELKINPTPHVDVIKVEGVNMPYFEVKYSDGTVCDLTGKRRSTRVLYVCFEQDRQMLYDVKEIFTCEYEIIVLTSLICEHPSYRPSNTPHTDLPCVSLNAESRKPKSLINLETESQKLQSSDTVLSGDLTGGTIKFELVIRTVEDIDEDGFKYDTTTTHTKLSRDSSSPFPTQPSPDIKLIEEFLKGEHCLEGGAGYWKFTYCHGKMVQQFHEEQDERYIILLGTFDEEKHIAWIKQRPTKRFNKGESTQVSHFYTGGDMCDVDGGKKPRQVEVKLKCVKSDRITSLTLFLLEPKVCEYVLVIQTPIVCPLLSKTNEYGLFEVDHPLDSDFLKAPPQDTITVVIKSYSEGKEGNTEQLKDEGKEEDYEELDEDEENFEGVTFKVNKIPVN